MFLFCNMDMMKQASSLNQVVSTSQLQNKKTTNLYILNVKQKICGKTSISYYKRKY